VAENTVIYQILNQCTNIRVLKSAFDSIYINHTAKGTKSPLITYDKSMKEYTQILLII